MLVESTVDCNPRALNAWSPGVPLVQSRRHTASDLQLAQNPNRKRFLSFIQNDAYNLIHTISRGMKFQSGKHPKPGHERKVALAYTEA